MSPGRVSNRYALPVIKKTRAEVQDAVIQGLESCRYAEVWLDYIEDLDPNFATSLVGLYPNRLIFVFRRKNLEPMKMAAEKRYQMMVSLARKQALVDLDISTQADEITRLQNERVGLKTILSYHNYTATPSDTELRSITSMMQGWDAHIIKVSAMCTTQRDALRLLSLLIDLRESGKKSIILGMGKHGVITRVFGSMWGNEMTFAPLDPAESSAPGQLSVDQLNTVMSALR
jgi:3-dehydroquinate dehydratase-1